MLTAALLITGAAVTIHLARTSGAPAAAAFGFVAALTTLPFGLYTVVHASEATRTSITDASIVVDYAQVVLFLFALLGSLRVVQATPIVLLLVPLCLFTFSAYQDDLVTSVVAGVVQWVTVALAAGLGAAVWTSSDWGISDRDALLVVAYPVMANFGASLLQIVGLRSVGTVELGGGSLERVSGLQGHSGNLGKILILLLVVALPLTRSSSAAVRRISLVSIAMMLVMVGLSYSRANTVGFVVALVLWFLLGSGGSGLKRLLVPALVGAASLPFAAVLIARNSEDPSGGSRPQLTEAALTQLRESWLLGIGPNDYQRTVGQFSMISSVLPVHNAFLLVLVECGVIVSALLAVYAVGVAFRAMRACREPSAAGLQAAALVATLPAVFAVAYTGHGIVGRDALPLLAFVMGWTSGVLRSPGAVLERARGTLGPPRELAGAESRREP